MISKTRVTGTIGACTALLASLILVLPAPAANAVNYTYNRKAAVTYAQKYSCNGKLCRNGAYNAYENDCTNFVSQALRAGGMPLVTTTNLPWVKNYPAWIAVASFREFMVDVAHRGTYRKTIMTAAYTSADKGDVYLYDWGQGHGYSHVSISTGWGKFGSFYDSSKKMNYNAVTHGSGDKMAQHTTDRDGAPWNWGYHTERKPKTRAKMRTLIIHMKDSGSF
jgi:hypothetical protein